MVCQYLLWSFQGLHRELFCVCFLATTRKWKNLSHHQEENTTTKRGLKGQGLAAFYTRGLSPSDGLRFSAFFPRFFWMVFRVFKKRSLKTYNDQNKFLKNSLRFLFLLFSSDRFWTSDRFWSSDRFWTSDKFPLWNFRSPSIFSNLKPSASPSISDQKPFNSRLSVFALSLRLGYWRSSLSLPHQVRSLFWLLF